MTASIDPNTCPHPTFRSSVDICRILADETDLTPAYYSVEIKVHCMICERPLAFTGLPVGFSPYGPTKSLSSTKAHLPAHFPDKPIPEDLASYIKPLPNS